VCACVRASEHVCARVCVCMCVCACVCEGACVQLCLQLDKGVHLYGQCFVHIPLFVSTVGLPGSQCHRRCEKSSFGPISTSHLRIRTCSHSSEILPLLAKR